jgi:hypothetical protein
MVTIRIWRARAENPLLRTRAMSVGGEKLVYVTPGWKWLRSPRLTVLSVHESCLYAFSASSIAVIAFTNDIYALL